MDSIEFGDILLMFLDDDLFWKAKVQILACNAFHRLL